MDVYHKVLTKVYELTGGKETEEVDLTDLLKREGFYSNIQGITQYLLSESWLTEGSRPYVVKMTHWGVAEAKRTISQAPDLKAVVEKDAKRLLTDTRELVIMLEEFAADPSEDKLAVIETNHSSLGGLIKRIRGNI